MSRHGSVEAIGALALTLLLVACGADAPRDTKGTAPALAPIQRITVERDLLADAGATKECAQRLRLEVPERSGLDLAVQAIRSDAAAPGSLGPLRLRLAIDGAVIFESVRTTDESVLTVTESVSLERLAGRTVDLDLEICDVGPGNALLWAKRLWLTRESEIARQPADDGQNLLFLLVDTLRADHLGAYGHDRPSSPRFDRLAAEGRLFEQAISASSWTLPAVASILTGTPPIEHRVVEGVALPLGLATIAERMQDRGVTTWGFSSNPLVGKLEAAHRGFESFAQVPWARADEVNRAFLSWLDGHGDSRWFAYLHYIDPHAPYGAPAPHGQSFTEGCATRYADGEALDALSDAVNLGGATADVSPAELDCLSRLYDGEIRFWDAQLDALLGSLAARGMLDRTTVVVTADHGEELLEHGHLLHGYQLYQESVRVPLVIWRPGRIEPARVERPIETRALFATALELMGIESPTGSPSSLLSRGAGSNGAVFSHTTEAFIPGHGYTVLASLRDGSWKYLFRPEDGREELFDLAGDPFERSNLIAAQPEVRARLGAALRGWLASGRQGWEQARGVDQQSLDRLRAMGYIR